MIYRTLLALLLSCFMFQAFSANKAPYFDPTYRTPNAASSALFIGPPTDQRLEAIIVQKHHTKTAIIDDVQFHIGNSLGHWKIIRIDATSVYLQHNSQTATIRLTPKRYVQLSPESHS